MLLIIMSHSVAYEMWHYDTVNDISTAPECVVITVTNFLLSRISAKKFTEMRRTSFPDLHALEKQSNEVDW